MEAKWLGGARGPLRKLLATAGSRAVTDAELVAAVSALERNLPEVFGPALNTEALALAMEKAMGAAGGNGAVAGYLARRGAFKK